MKFNVLQNGYLGYPKFWVFDHQNHNFDFSKLNAQNLQFFYRYRKTGIHVIELCVTNRCTKFQANIFIFGCAMAQKPGEGDDVTFLNRIFWHL